MNNIVPLVQLIERMDARAGIFVFLYRAARSARRAPVGEKHKFQQRVFHARSEPAGQDADTA